MSPPTMTTIAELKEDKKQMEEYIAELEEDKKQMEEHYETAVMTDEELIAEFKKRFIVPQFYRREHIIERIEQNHGEPDGFVPPDDKVDELIEKFQDDAYLAVDEILDEYILNVDFEPEEEEEEEDDDHDICGQTGGKCGDFAGCGKKVLCEDTNMFGNTSFCIPCYEKYEDDFKKLEEEEDHVKTEAVGVLDESDDEDDEEVRCVCEDCFLEGRIMVSKKRAEYLKKNVITEYSCVVCGSVAADE